MFYNKSGKYIEKLTMDIYSTSLSTLGYSDTLTSPFLVKKVTINSHTPYDTPKAEPEAYSRGSFPQIKSTSTARLHPKSYNVGVIDFSKKSADIVKEMISDGYTAVNAIDMQKAVTAYGLNALNASGVSLLSNNVYEA